MLRLMNLRAHARAAARMIGHKIFRNPKRRRPYEPDLSRLAENLSGVRGASPVWCSGCGALLTPLVLGDGEETRLVAVSCLPCAVALPVRAGLLMGGEPANATIH
jgi:hypothetical protein